MRFHMNTHSSSGLYIEHFPSISLPEKCYNDVIEINDLRATLRNA